MRSASVLAVKYSEYDSVNNQVVFYSSKSVREKVFFKTENDWRKQIYFDSIAKSMDRSHSTVLKNRIWFHQNKKSKKVEKTEANFRNLNPKKVDW